MGARQAQDVAGVNKSLADISLNRASSISDLAKQLQNIDLQEREFSLKRQQAERDYQLAVQASRSKASAGSRPTATQQKNAAFAELGQDILAFFQSPNYRGRSKPGYTEDTVIPQLIQAYPELTPADISKRVYALRKQFGE